MALTPIKGKLPVEPTREPVQTIPAQDPHLRRDIDDIQRQVRQLPLPPFGKWQYVEVTFEDADEDTDVPHTLRPSDPESVRWWVVALNAGAVIYKADTGTAWHRDHIWLRADQPCTVRLLLFLETLNA